jgi:hypothetical protein
MSKGLAREPTFHEIIGVLLRDDAMLFGRRVRLAWPDGLPSGYTEASLRELGENWCPVPQERPFWEAEGSRP